MSRDASVPELHHHHSRELLASYGGSLPEPSTGSLTPESRFDGSVEATFQEALSILEGCAAIGLEPEPPQDRPSPSLGSAPGAGVGVTPEEAWLTMPPSLLAIDQPSNKEYRARRQLAQMQEQLTQAYGLLRRCQEEEACERAIVADELAAAQARGRRLAELRRDISVYEAETDELELEAQRLKAELEAQRRELGEAEEEPTEDEEAEMLHLLGCLTEVTMRYRNELFPEKLEEYSPEQRVVAKFLEEIQAHDEAKAKPLSRNVREARRPSPKRAAGKASQRRPSPVAKSAKAKRAPQR